MGPHGTTGKADRVRYVTRPCVEDETKGNVPVIRAPWTKRMMRTLKNIWTGRSTWQRKRNESLPPSSTTDLFSTGERWILLGVILLFVVLVRVRLLDVPLERDEGEYAYIGQQLLQGFPPYSAYTMKFPGTSLMYALMLALFGQTVQGIHLGFLVLNCATVLLLYLLCKRLANDVAAIIASGTYAVLSLSAMVFGFAAHATHFVALPAVGGALVLLKALEKNKMRHYALSGILFGLAFLMKQPGVFFAVFGAAYAGVSLYSSRTALPYKEKNTNFALLLFSMLLPLLVVMAWLSVAGVFGTFWFWTVQYAAKYGSQIPLSSAFPVFWNKFLSVADGFSLFWIASGLGFLIILFHRDLKRSRMFLVLFIVFSFLSICPGFYFREHYFVLLLPAVSIASGILFNYINAGISPFYKAPQMRFAGFGIFIAVALACLMGQKEYFVKDDPVIISQKMYSDNPFAESPQIARFISERSTPADRIAVLGSEPQIYFYSHRLSATGHIYMYGLMEHHRYGLSMQQEMAREIEAANPKFIVVVNVVTSWLIRPDSEKFIVGWLGNYLRNGYTPVGVVDLQRSGPTVYKWNDEIKNYTIRSPSYVLIYERI